MPSTVTDRIDGITTSAAVKTPVRVIAVASITLSGVQTIDGVLLTAYSGPGLPCDRVLVNGQVDQTTNGIYLVQTGSWTREPDFDGARDAVTGTLVYVRSGTTYAGTLWDLTTTDNPIIIGTSNITFTINPVVAPLMTSATSNVIGTGAKTFTTQPGLGFATGQFLTIADAANAANYMHGQVTSYSGTTLIMNILDVGGSGTKTAWVITLSAPTGPAGPAGSNGTNGTNGTNGAGNGKNYLVNGAFNIAQRTSSYALTTSFAYGSADRWAFQMATSAAGIANIIASGLAGFKNALKLGRNSGSALTNLITARQAMESIESIPLQGQTVVLSFYAKAGANFSQVSSTLSSNIRTGTGTDQSAATMTAWTGQANTSGPNTITTSWVRYSYTATIPSNATQVGIDFSYTPSGTAGADDNVYITGVKLEIASVASAYEHPLPSVELEACQRWLPIFNSLSTTSPVCSAYANTTTAGIAIFQFPVQPRAQLSGITLSNAGHFSFNSANTSTVLTSLTFANSAFGSAWLAMGVASGFTANAGGMLFASSASGQIIFTGAEL